MDIVFTKSGPETSYGWQSGDQPGDPRFDRPVPRQLAERILPVLRSYLPEWGEPVEIHSLGECRHLVGRYRLSLPSQSWFIRISSLAGHPNLEQALVNHLADADISVNRLYAAGLPIEMDNVRYRLDIRPFIAARHGNGSSADLTSLAQVVRSTHDRLKHFPGAAEIQAIARERFSLLAPTAELIPQLVADEKWECLASFPRWAEANAGYLLRAAQGFDTALPDAPTAQCLHGQLHQANVMFTSKGAILVDFEESVHVFAETEWDLAHVIQRFCLHDSPSADLLKNRLAQVREAYGRFDLTKCWDFMRQVCWFSSLILVQSWQTLRLQPREDELEKFVRFEKQANFYEGLLTQ